jgi:hypothetical protein
MNEDLKDLKTEIEILKGEVGRVRDELHRNSFSSKEFKLKQVIFNGGLVIRQRTATPSVGDIGELCVVGGKLYICTATTPTWVVVGTQS